jgi:gas vesicle protein
MIRKSCELCTHLKEKNQELTHKNESLQKDIIILTDRRTNFGISHLHLLIPYYIVDMIQNDSSLLSKQSEALQELTKSQSDTIKSLTESSVKLEEQVNETTSKLERALKTNAELTRVCQETDVEKTKYREEMIKWRDVAEDSRNWITEHQDMVEDYKWYILSF